MPDQTALRSEGGGGRRRRLIFFFDTPAAAVARSVAPSLARCVAGWLHISEKRQFPMGGNQA